MKIKFSHKYPKLFCNGDLIINAFLIEVILIDVAKLSDEFIRYDTGDGLYKLPKKGKFLMLIFRKSGSDIFTTIRRWTEKKEVYYRKQIGKDFEIVVGE